MDNNNLCIRLEIIAEDLSKPMNATINEAINLLSKNSNMDENTIQKLKDLYFELSGCTGDFAAWYQPIADRLKLILESAGMIL